MESIVCGIVGAEEYLVLIIFAPVHGPVRQQCLGCAPGQQGLSYGVDEFYLFDNEWFLHVWSSLVCS